MILTGKAKKDFHKWVNNNGYHEEVIYNSVINALIIEWLDSVGIYVSIEPSIPVGWENPDCFIFRVDTDTNRLKFTNRQQATEKAIIKAVEIYNKRGN